MLACIIVFELISLWYKFDLFVNIIRLGTLYRKCILQCILRMLLNLHSMISHLKIPTFHPFKVKTRSFKNLNFMDFYIFIHQYSNRFRSLGLAEAGLIDSKLSRNDMNPSDHDESFLNFCPRKVHLC